MTVSKTVWKSEWIWILQFKILKVWLVQTLICENLRSKIFSQNWLMNWNMMKNIFKRWVDGIWFACWENIVAICKVPRPMIKTRDMLVVSGTLRKHRRKCIISKWINSSKLKCYTLQDPRISMMRVTMRIHVLHSISQLTNIFNDQTSTLKNKTNPNLIMIVRMTNSINKTVQENLL